MVSANNEPADSGDTANWSNSYGVTHPVLAEPNAGVGYSLIQGGYPTYVILDREMVIVVPDAYPFNPTQPTNYF